MNKVCFLLTFLLMTVNTFSQNNAGSWFSELVAAKSIDDRIYLIFKLAEIKRNELPAADQQSITKILLKWYREEPNAGLHSAIDYLLRPSKKGEVPRAITWNLAQELEKIDRQLQKKGNKNAEWFLTPQLHTMSVMGPGSFFMGSPPNEKYRTDDELLHTVDIPRKFSISTKEVTVAQFQEFLEANPLIKEAAKKDAGKFPSVENKKLLVFSPEPDCSQIYVTWYEAAQYCNWLSKKDGIPESEWCYPPNEMIKSGMTLSKDHLKRKGYRLPTEAEWEYATRGSTSLSHFFGESDSLLSQYAWYSKNPPQKKGDPIDPNDPKHTYPVGQLEPNSEGGFFDVYGNVWEWCGSVRQPYPSRRTVDEPTADVVITDSVAMVRRGGSFSYGKEVMRSAHRGALNYFPSQRRDNVGFRIARTISLK